MGGKEKNNFLCGMKKNIEFCIKLTKYKDPKDCFFNR